MPEVHTLTVAEVIVETPDARSVVFELTPEQAEAFRYRPGQFLTLRVGEAARCYSLSSAPHEGTRLKVTVKRTEGGYGSNWICANVRPGAAVDVLAPAGVFTPKDFDENLLLFAGGSGITPVMSILKTALRQGTGRVTLVYANRDEQSVIFAGELAALAREFPDRFVVLHWLESVQGLPNVEQLRALARPFAEFEAFLCGPAPFMAAAKQALTDLGVPRKRIHLERFVSLGGNPFAVERGAPAGRAKEPGTAREAGAATAAEDREQLGAATAAENTEQLRAATTADNTEQPGAAPVAGSTKQPEAATIAEGTEQFGTAAVAESTEQPGAASAAAGTEQPGTAAVAESTESGTTTVAETAEQLGVISEANQTRRPGATTGAGQTEQFQTTLAKDTQRPAAIPAKDGEQPDTAALAGEAPPAGAGAPVAGQSGAEPASPSDGATRLRVDLDGVRHEYAWPRQRKLLDFLLDQGLDAPYSCREGQCSACACRLVAGEVKMLNNEVLDSDDIADGIVLACQSVPLTDEVSVTYE
ncbi:hypothetical protein GCM10023214_32830 [Amycolatopsis dongchuanensis]|uniref:Ferredoxin-NADP reductase n=2 Tax=Amycolatopsis TaxID=1813 RepID=A0A1I3W5T4_9PSEU|nr:Ferredoxin-NADP reductase [Amycolatopsis sacchari]